MTLKGIQSFFISKDLIFFFLSEHSLKIVYNLLLKGELVRCYHKGRIGKMLPQLKGRTHL